MEKEELDKIAKLRNWDKIIAALEAAGYERVTVENKYNCPLSDFKGCEYAASEYGGVKKVVDFFNTAYLLRG